ncbi:uncharacterized protein LOC117646773 [Thrips palmi]|uniref:Uncharacterized protein LOC117646773 n=1 Tax=Thrips palmi TaxID=161013 RepID=A0A6P8Z9U6_THRPL|nr:uncharacterized protein LOC117646773 [Thrips palmi]
MNKRQLAVTTDKKKPTSKGSNKKHLDSKWESNCQFRGRDPTFPATPKGWVENKMKLDITVGLDYIPQVISNTDDLNLYNNRILLSEAKAVDFSIETVSQSDCPMWMQRRKLLFTGSKAYEI